MQIKKLDMCVFASICSTIVTPPFADFVFFVCIFFAFVVVVVPMCFVFPFVRNPFQQKEMFISCSCIALFLQSG